LTAAGLGYGMQAGWTSLPLWAKTFAGCIPVATLAMMKLYYNKRNRFDDLLQRNKFISSNIPAIKIDKNVKFLDGEGVVKTNQLLMDAVIKPNEMEYPGMKQPRMNWRTLIIKNTDKWYMFFEDGTVILPKDIVTKLSRNELTALLAIQSSHILAKHYSELTSHCQLVNYLTSITGGLFCFFVPVFHSYYVDVPCLLSVCLAVNWSFLQLKYKKLLLEADTLALRMVSKQGVTSKDFMSLFEKLKETRKEIPFMKRFKTMCYYDTRINAIRGYVQPVAYTSRYSR